MDEVKRVSQFGMANRMLVSDTLIIFYFRPGKYMVPGFLLGTTDWPLPITGYNR